ncbi:MAG TPA: trehalase family glycosidase [Candidatus Saccharimonadales bacterium]|nr:trehalase family glycosidase [Candidatus Saccharimonadales bacterium]
MSTEPDLFEQAKEILKMNDRGLYTVPAEPYPHQWLWDSCFIAIGQRHYDVERAKMEILSLLRGQWSNGMVPNMIFSRGRQYRHDQNIWRSWVSPYAPDKAKTSGITQPPMLAEAIVRVGEKLPLTERRSWYRQVWPNLLAYHEWLYRERDPHGEGLVLLIHPWETGLDNTPPWMSELQNHLLPGWVRVVQKTKLDTIIGWFRRDTRVAPQGQRLTTIEALALFDAQRRLRRKAYDINDILDHSLFAIEDLAFNCIFIRANAHLLQIAKSIRADVPSELVKRMELSAKVFDDLWDPYTEMYYPRDFVTHRLLKEPSVASLLPLYAGCISEERAALVVKMLENEHLFGPPYPVPSAPPNSPWFDPNRYWQGPTWFNINWLIIDGLERYGYKHHAAALAESTLELAERHGFYEYFNPLTGEPLGAPTFSWTAALTIDLIKTGKG